MQYERPVVGPDLIPRATPRPRPAGSGLPHPISSAALRTVCSHSPSQGVSPGMKDSPLRARLRRRSSTGSRPRARAASFMFDSTAQFGWGAPKPRKAVAGGVCERMLLATIRAAGTRYGPQEM